ncbi:hypothetical protein Cgig2_000854 [Carnegiea gigantea]|uniref:Aminotransferase-like plant mobile domain-containing protein n=1 Tax=Carnegiea gigantea TaxID=171969 RepID=A0A9Q1JZS8_9CARY|nr:hypothetical protein Cgig2_000854 [Carnegiea gigantea]
MGIYGVVDVSCYPYHFDRDLWGPLTNTLHHGAGEVGIFLYDLERIASLPILGNVYEEFLPHNEDLMDDEKFSPTVLELLRTHAELCRFRSEQSTSSSPPRISQRVRPLTLNVTNIGELAIFLAFWLSRFVLPYHNEVIRPKTFVMASLMAKGQKISLTPTVLGYIYYGLGQVTSHPNNPGRANPCSPIHYVVGWLAEVFSTLYVHRLDSECPVDYPTLIRYAGIQDSTQALLANRVRVFRSVKILDSLVDESHLSTVEEAFNTAEIVAKMEGLVDIERLRFLSSQDSAYTSDIAHMEDNLKELSSETLELELSEKEILKEEERLRKMRKDLMNQKQKLITTEEDLRASLHFKRKKKERLQVELAEAGVTKLQVLEKETHQLNNLVNSIVFFNKY